MATGVLVALCLLPLALGCALPPTQCPHQGYNQMGAMQVGMQGQQNYQNMVNLGSVLSGAGQNMAVGGAGQGQWWTAQSQKDMSEYQRWSQEKEAKQAALQQSMQILAHIKQQKAAQDAYEQQVHAQMNQGTPISVGGGSASSAASGVSAAVVTVQRQQAAMATQFQQWSKLFNQQQLYKAMMTKFTTMSEQYTYCLTLELLKFCQNADVMSAVSRYSGNTNYTLDLSPGADASMFDLSELEGVDVTNAVAVASRIYTYDAVLQTKIAYGGLVKSMCDGARNYVARVRTWEAQYLR